MLCLAHHLSCRASRLLSRYLGRQVSRKLQPTFLASRPIACLLPFDLLSPNTLCGVGACSIRILIRAAFSTPHARAYYSAQHKDTHYCTVRVSCSGGMPCNGVPVAVMADGVSVMVDVPCGVPVACGPLTARGLTVAPPLLHPAASNTHSDARTITAIARSAVTDERQRGSLGAHRSNRIAAQAASAEYILRS